MIAVEIAARDRIVETLEREQREGWRFLSSIPSRRTRQAIQAYEGLKGDDLRKVQNALGARVVSQLTWDWRVPRPPPRFPDLEPFIAAQMVGVVDRSGRRSDFDDALLDVMEAGARKVLGTRQRFSRRNNFCRLTGRIGGEETVVHILSSYGKYGVTVHTSRLRDWDKGERPVGSEFTNLLGVGDGVWDAAKDVANVESLQPVVEETIRRSRELVDRLLQGFAATGQG